MKDALQVPSAPAQQAERDLNTPLRLDQCGDVLTIAQVCRVLQISRSHYYELVRHAAFPIKPMKSLGESVRYAKAAVESYLRRAS